MRITVLTENTTNGALPAEHGLSLYIETGERKILFDIGQSALFAENAEKLGIDLRSVDICVLSHGHYDHGGGLMRFLQINETAPVYMSRCAFEPHYNGEKYIGLDPALQGNEQIRFVDGAVTITEGISLFPLPDEALLSHIDPAGLSMIEGGEKLPEDFRHELYLLIEESSKRVLFSGCSHKGAVNIASHFHPDVFIGGFHLSKYPLDGTLDAIGDQLADLSAHYYTCHCTGTEQYEYLKSRMPALDYLSVGDSIKL